MAKTKATYNNLVVLTDEKPQNTTGGTATSGIDNIRTLNTSYPASLPWWVSLTANQFTLQPGMYRIKWSTPADQCHRHQSFLYSVTGALTLRRGNSSHTNSSSDVINRSEGIYTGYMSAVTVLEIRHRVQSTAPTNGLGVESNFGTEVYTTVDIKRVA